MTAPYGRYLAAVLLLTTIIQPPVSAEAQRRRGRRAQPESVSTEATHAGFRLESLRAPGGLTADQAASRAAERAPSIEQARALSSAARAEATAAAFQMLPTVEGQGRYTRVNIESGGLTSPEEQQELGMLVAGVDDPEAQSLLGALTSYQFPVFDNQYAVRASVTVPISDLFVTLLPSFLAAADLADAREFELEAARATLELQARQSYFGYLRARGSMVVAQASLENAEENLRQVRSMARAGAVSGLDQRRVEAQAAATRVVTERSRGMLYVAERTLRTLLHLDDDDELNVDEDLTTDVPVETRSVAQLVSAAREQRPEVRAAREFVDARGSAATAVAGTRWPSILAVGNYDYGRPNANINPAVNAWRSTWDVSVVVRWSPTDALVQAARHSAASSLHEHARAALEALEDAVEVETTSAYREQIAAQASIEAAQLGVEAAEAAYRGRVAQFRSGAAVTADLLDADADLSIARLNLLNAAIDVRIARARLLRAIGE